MQWQPRNDYVLVRVSIREETEGGVALPQVSIQGKKFTVEAIGPKVEGLSVGDEVMMVGHHGANYYELPNSKDMIVIKQECIVLAMRDTQTTLHHSITSGATCEVSDKTSGFANIYSRFICIHCKSSYDQLNPAHYMCGILPTCKVCGKTQMSWDKK